MDKHPDISDSAGKWQSISAKTSKYGVSVNDISYCTQVCLTPIFTHVLSETFKPGIVLHGLSSPSDFCIRRWKRKFLQQVPKQSQMAAEQVMLVQPGVGKVHVEHTDYHLGLRCEQTQRDASSATWYLCKYDYLRLPDGVYPADKHVFHCFLRYQWYIKEHLWMRKGKKIKSFHCGLSTHLPSPISQLVNWATWENPWQYIRRMFKTKASHRFDLCGPCKHEPLVYSQMLFSDLFV